MKIIFITDLFSHSVFDVSNFLPSGSVMPIGYSDLVEVAMFILCLFEIIGGLK